MISEATTPVNPDPLLSVKQAESYSQLSASLLRRRIADGTIPVIRFGARAVRVRLSDLEAYLEKGDPS